MKSYSAKWRRTSSQALCIGRYQVWKMHVFQCRKWMSRATRKLRNPQRYIPKTVLFLTEILHSENELNIFTTSKQHVRLRLTIKVGVVFANGRRGLPPELKSVGQSQCFMRQIRHLWAVVTRIRVSFRFIYVLTEARRLESRKLKCACPWHAFPFLFEDFMSTFKTKKEDNF